MKFVLSKEDIQKQFHLPLEQAAQNLCVCPSILKKQCRLHGIAKWPYRKLRSLSKKAWSLESSAKTAIQQYERIKSQIEELNQEKKAVVVNHTQNIHHPLSNSVNEVKDGSSKHHNYLETTKQNYIFVDETSKKQLNNEPQKTFIPINRDVVPQSNHELSPPSSAYFEKSTDSIISHPKSIQGYHSFPPVSSKNDCTNEISKKTITLYRDDSLSPSTSTYSQSSNYSQHSDISDENINNDLSITDSRSDIHRNVTATPKKYIDKISHTINQDIFNPTATNGHTPYNQHNTNDCEGDGIPIMANNNIFTVKASNHQVLPSFSTSFGDLIQSGSELAATNPIEKGTYQHNYVNISKDCRLKATFTISERGYKNHCLEQSNMLPSKKYDTPISHLSMRSRDENRHCNDSTFGEHIYKPITSFLDSVQSLVSVTDELGRLIWFSSALNRALPQQFNLSSVGGIQHLHSRFQGDANIIFDKIYDNLYSNVDITMNFHRPQYSMAVDIHGVRVGGNNSESEDELFQHLSQRRNNRTGNTPTKYGYIWFLKIRKNPLPLHYQSPSTIPKVDVILKGYTE